MAAEDEDFIRLKNVDNSFQERSNFVFAQLEGLEPNPDHPEHKGQQQKDKNTRKSHRTRMPSRVPEHVLSPEKWTKYSLKIDGSENLNGMNKHNLNKYAAHTFLKVLRKRKDEEITPEDNDAKVSFHKPSVSTETNERSGVWKDGTFVMPAYIVGSSQPKKKSGKRTGVKPHVGCAKVSLGHLGVEDEEENKQETNKVDEVKERERQVFRKRKHLGKEDEIKKSKKKKDEIGMNDIKESENKK